LAGLARSSYYYESTGTETPENLALMRIIDRIYMKYPFYGSPRMRVELERQGHPVNVKRVARLMQVMGLQAKVPGPHTSRPHPEHRVYPYLLRGLQIKAPNEVWGADITYIPLRHGFMYLMAILDWFSRYVLAWDISNTMETAFCVETLDRALKCHGPPGIFNTDQGSQFTSEDFTGRLQTDGIRISMDGQGRALDNVFVERLWRSVKYEDIYLRDYTDGWQLRQGLTDYFRFYHTDRPHQALDYRTPAEVYMVRKASA
jgi:putative transposase